MNDDDLLRKLEKLVALKEHPSTLPAIRDEAARAEERLRGILDNDYHLQGRPPQESRFRRQWNGRERRFHHIRGTVGGETFDHICEVLNRETQKIWPGIRPKVPR